MFSKKKKGTVFLRGAKTQGGNSGTVFYFNCFQLADLQRKIVTGKKRPLSDADTCIGGFWQWFMLEC
jgi:hypothetical protein